QPDPVDDRMRNHQAYRGPAVLEGKHPEMPAGAPLRINGEAHPLVGPGAHIGAPPRRCGDIDLLRGRRHNPVITRERYRGTFDPASQQPASKIALKTPQPINIDATVIDPDELNLRAVNRSHGEKYRLIHVC